MHEVRSQKLPTRIATIISAIAASAPPQIGPANKAFRHSRKHALIGYHIGPTLIGRRNDKKAARTREPIEALSWLLVSRWNDTLLPLLRHALFDLDQYRGEFAQCAAP